jgi:hypothetical protein
MADHCYADCRYTECRYAECRVLFTIMLSVVAPFKCFPETNTLAYFGAMTKSLMASSTTDRES